MRDSISTARISGPEHQPDGTVAFEFRFAVEDSTFTGHFPTRPLLPGVFLLEMSRTAVEWVLDRSMAVLAISKAKFLRPILPAELVRLDLKWSEADGAVQARSLFSVGGQRAGEVLMSLRKRP